MVMKFNPWKMLRSGILVRVLVKDATRVDKGALSDEGTSMLLALYGCECLVKVPKLFSC